MAFKDLGAEFICTDHPSENSFPVDGLEGDSLLQDRLALLHAKCKSFYDNNKIILRFPSVGATENILLYSAFSGRKVDLYNAAREPEIIDLQQYLNKIGANITGAGTSHITIFAKNYNQLKDAHSIDCSHTIIPDRIEGGTYILACAVCGGSIKLKNTNCRELGALLRLINGTGDSLTDNEITFKFKKRPSINECITTLPYPGVPTDLQAPLMSFLCTVQGTNYIIESIFKNRTSHINELIKMGANIKKYQNCFVIRGQSCLQGCDVVSGDLRGGAALIIAALGATGISNILDNGYIARGYTNIENKLAMLGADITKKIIPSNI